MDETSPRQRRPALPVQARTPLDAALLWVFFLALACYKQPAILLQGRFFAEEGSYFFPRLCDRGFLDSLSFLFLGRLELVTNLAAWLASHFPLAHAPRVTVFFALAAQSLPVFLLGYTRRDLGISLAGCFLFTFLLVSLPQMPEVFLNTTSIHFHFAFLAALILLLPAPQDRLRHLFRGLLLASGLSGVTASFILPFFLLRAYLEKDRERLYQAIPLISTTLLQTALVLLHGEPRDMGQNLPASAISFIIHQMITPLVGFQAMGQTSVLLQELPARHFAGAPLAFAAVLGWAAAWFAILRSRRQAGFYALGLNLFLVAALSIFSLSSMASCMGIYCMRYFFVQNCLFLLALIMGLHQSFRAGRFFLGAYLSIMLLAALSTNFLFRVWDAPAWPEALQKAMLRYEPGRPLTVDIWPPKWVAVLPGQCVDPPKAEVGAGQQAIPGRANQ